MRDPSGFDLASLDNVLVTRLDVTDTTSLNAAVSEGIELISWHLDELDWCHLLTTIATMNTALSTIIHIDA